MTTMEIEYLIEFWVVTKQYLDNKERQLVADHAINALVELGIDDNELNELAGVDSYMANAVRDHIDTSEDEDE
jgi:hypothetical protein